MLLEITLAIVFGKIFSFAFEKIKQPGLIGEILAGVVLGPCVIGLISGSSLSISNTAVFQFNLNLASPEFKQIAFIGAVFLLFIAGLETNLSGLKKTKKAGLGVGIIGVIVPFLFGCMVGTFFHFSLIQCMAIGTIFLATSTTIAIRILSDIGPQVHLAPLDRPHQRGADVVVSEQPGDLDRPVAGRFDTHGVWHGLPVPGHREGPACGPRCWLVRWRLNTGTLNTETKLRDAPFASDLRNVYNLIPCN